MSDLMPRIIPCLDVANGRVVKGVNFKGLTDMGDPTELATRYEAQGADEIIFLDIAASPDKQPTALKAVTDIARNLQIPFSVGGGLNQYSDVSAFLDAGADKVTLNTSAVRDPQLIERAAKGYGSQCVVVAIDVNREADGQLGIYTHGGRNRVDLKFSDWVREVADRGAGEILLTAMHCDGTGEGFDNELLAWTSAAVPIQVIASGGASRPHDFLQTFKAGSDAALAAGMFHRGEYSVADVKKYLAENGVRTRQPYRS